jgi:hypothetical protein
MEASILCFLEPGYDKWYQSYVDCRTPALARTVALKDIYISNYLTKFYCLILFSF